MVHRGALALLVFALMASWAAPGSAGEVEAEPARRPLLAAAEQLQVDSLLDNILLTVQREMFSGGVDVEVLPDVSLRNKQLTLTGTEGIVKGLTTLYRSDSAVMEYGNGSVILSSALSLQSLQITYRVNAKYLFLSLTNDVSASVAYNRVQVRAGIFYSGDVCYVGIQDVSVDLLQGIQWRTSGFGSINALVSSAINLLVPPATIQANLNKALQQAMGRFKAQCHSFIPGVDSGKKWKC